jgi:ribosomal-protein-alanine N-acetyltransferase
MIYELHKNKLNVLNFAVAPPYRRQGIGTQMIGKLVAKLTTHRRSKVTLAVRESNLSAQLFFRQQEFKAVKVLKNFYEDSGEDAFLMEFRVGSEDDDDLDRVVNRIARYEQN